MRVCLVAATRFPVANSMPWPSLGIAYIASMLERHGHEVRIVDREIDSRKWPVRESADAAFLRAIRDFAPEMVGISATTPNIPDAHHVAGLTKREFPNAVILVGGAHASILPDQTLDECGAIDIVVRGEGEYPTLELAEGKSPRDVESLVLRDGDRHLHTPARKPNPVLDDYPMPAWHLLDMDFYLRRNAEVIRGVKLRATHVFTSRGCPYNCYFCANQAIPGVGIRFHSSRRVLDEVALLSERYGVEGIYFIDDLFAVNKKRVREICDALIGAGYHRKIVWASQERVNCVDEEILRRMKSAGCIQVEFGFESGSQRILDSINKRTTVAQNLAAAEMTRRVGLRLGANAIGGLPDETDEDIRMTIDLLKRIRPDFTGFWRFSPSVGSPFFFRLKEAGKLDDDWLNYVAREDRNYAALPDDALNRIFAEVADDLVISPNERNSLRYNSSENRFFRYGILERIMRKAWMYRHDVRRALSRARAALGGG